MKVIAVIPARYHSTRLLGKPLLDICGKTMIERVYERVSQSNKISEVLVATDDKRIFDEVERFGGRVVMTKESHKSGTDRVYEACQPFHADLIVNVQGDEPLVSVDVIDELITEMISSGERFGTVAVKQSLDNFDVQNPNVVKLVCNKNNEALYFSRSVLPFPRNENDKVLIHWGIYAYTKDFLSQFILWGESELERIESLEQLRALENREKIKVVITNEHSIGVDTPEDLQNVRHIFEKEKANG